MNRAQRRAQAKQQRKNKASNFHDLDLLGHLWGLVDDCPDHVVDVIKGVVNSTVSMPQNRKLFISNANNNLTSEQQGLGYTLGNSYFTFRPYHVGKISGCSLDTCLEIFQEFLDDPNAQVYPCMYIDRDSKSIQQSLGYLGTKGNISIHPWIEPDTGRQTTLICTVSAEQCITKNLRQGEAA